jgi:hypothetical protein
MINSNNTTPKNELLIYSLFLYYILALSYTFFQKFNLQTEFSTFVFNISLSFVVCTVKSK